MRQLSFLLAALLVLAACGPGEKMRYVCNIQWSCNGEVHEEVVRACFVGDNPNLCNELLEDAREECGPNFIAERNACLCEGESAHSCPAEES